MNFAPVSTLEELDSLDDDDLREAFMSTERGDPEPGLNRGKAFWHGWRTRMMDFGEIEIDSDHRQLARLWLVRARNLRKIT